VHWCNKRVQSGLDCTQEEQACWVVVREWATNGAQEPLVGSGNSERDQEQKNIKHESQEKTESCDGGMHEQPRGFLTSKALDAAFYPQQCTSKASGSGSERAL
jgi:hypothetical protein